MQIFLSFHSKDRGLAQIARAGLMKLDPTASIFFSEVSLESGFWLPKIFKRIAEADSFLFIIGPNGIGPWQEVEYWTALQRHVEEGNQFPLVPLIAENSEAPGLGGLRGLNWIVAPNLMDDVVLHRILTALKGEAIAATSTPLWKLVNPYRGLESMTEANSDYFYGRNVQTAKILALLAEQPNRCPVLTGGSGVGKSSVAQAGVLSALKSMRWPADESSQPWPATLKNSRGWAILTMRPGVTPIKSLVSAFTRLWSLDLTDPEQAARPRSWVYRLQENENTLGDLIDATREQIQKREGTAPDLILTYIDQVEDLYTHASKHDAERFSSLLQEGLEDPRFRAFASLRADDFDHFCEDKAFLECSELVKIAPLTKNGLYEVVTKPARVLQVSFEDERLADRVTEAAAKEPGALPLLSYQLNDMWASMAKRGDAILRLPSQAIDVGGVLSSRAEEFLRAHPEKENSLRGLLTLKLVTFLPEGKPVPRQATRDECSDDYWDLATSLSGGDWRLIVIGPREADGKIVAELAHEAFLHAWPRLNRWLNDERDFLVFKGELERKEREWYSRGKADHELLSGHDLDQANRWAVSRQEDLTKEVLNFLSASRINEGVRKTRQLRLQWCIIAGSIVALVVVSVLSVGLWRLWGIADKELEKAETAESLRLANDASGQLSVGDDTSGMLLALEGLPDAATGINRPALPETELQLDRSLSRQHESAVLRSGGPVTAIHFNSDGNTITTISQLMTLNVWDSSTGKALGNALKIRADSVLRSATFSSDGNLIAIVLDDSKLLIWDMHLQKGHLLTIPSLRSAAFSHSGQRLVTADGNGTAQIWDVSSESRVGTPVQCSSLGIESVEFSPDDAYIITASGDGQARIFDISSGQPLGQPFGDNQGIASLEFSLDGKRVLTVSSDGKAKIWDAASGVAVGSLESQESDITSAKFSPDNRYIVTGSSNGTVRLWAAETGDPIRKFVGHERPVRAIAFSPDAKQIATGSEDGTTRLWTHDARRAGYVGSLAGHHQSAVRSAMFCADDKHIITASEDASAIVWDVATLTPIRTILPNQGPLFNASSSLDGSHVATAAANGVTQIWNVNTSDDRPEHSFQDDNRPIWATAFSPDASQIVTASANHRAIVWNVASERRLYVLSRHRDEVRSVAFSRDGKWIVTGSLDKTAILWDAHTGVFQKIIATHNGTVRGVAFSHDSHLVVTASVDGSIKIWNLKTDAPDRSQPLVNSSSTPFSSVAFNSDDTRLVTTADDGTTKIWDVKSGQLVGELPTLDSKKMWSAAYSSDGAFIVTASADSTATIWHSMTTQALVDYAKSLAPRCLTVAKRRSFFLVPEPPSWCIEKEKWPFDSVEWKNWQEARESRRLLPLPSDEP
jgi:WD40 repeat protein